MARCLLGLGGMCLSVAVACSAAGGGKDAGDSAAIPPVQQDVGPPALHDEQDGGPPHCPDYQPLGNLYWGDLHAHTSYSIDSYVSANRNDPKDAYAFARGSTVPIAAGQGGATRATIDRPLDFLAVTDHSEYLSVTGECLLGAAGNADSLYCKQLRDQGSTAQKALFTLSLTELARIRPQQPSICRGSSARSADCDTAARTAWQKEQQAASAANAPCAFTSLVAYEWSASTGTANLHRNVIFGSRWSCGEW